MDSKSKKSLRLILLLLAAGALGACGNVSHKIAEDGVSAGKLVWPAATSVTATHKGGVFPVLSTLRLIKPGMNKTQIINLIGAPHFSEGIAGVREWNYLFNFRDSNWESATQCQYKILFDDKKLARSFYWRPATCAERLDAAVVESKASVAKIQPEVLSTSIFFAGDKFNAADITLDGREKLNALAQKIKKTGKGKITIKVVGYADRMGSKSYNVDLSKKRANTVMQYLVEKGVAELNLSSDGYGAEEPVVQCSNKAGVALIRCLAPNRRVVVNVTGT